MSATELSSIPGLTQPATTVTATATTTTVTTTRTPPHKAARVRDNQRRSRARHREYVDALRARLARHEREGAQATAEMQRAARAVARENALLRALLAARGVGEEAVRGYLRSASAAGAAEAEGKGPVEVAEEGGAGRLACVLAEMERGRNGGGLQAADASPAAFSPPHPQMPGMPGMAPNTPIPIQLLPQREEPCVSHPRQTRERKDSHLSPERPTLPALGLALSAKRYDAIRDCLELPKVLDRAARTDGITN